MNKSSLRVINLLVLFCYPRSWINGLYCMEFQLTCYWTKSNNLLAAPGENVSYTNKSKLDLLSVLSADQWENKTLSVSQKFPCNVHVIGSLHVMTTTHSLQRNISAVRLDDVIAPCGDMNCKNISMDGTSLYNFCLSLPHLGAHIEQCKWIRAYLTQEMPGTIHRWQSQKHYGRLKRMEQFKAQLG